jgi:FkbM family methyltransferase
MTLRKLIRTSIFLLARKLGFIAIPEWRLDSYFLAMRLKRIISEYKIDCFFDVGANVGQYHDFLRDQVEYDGLIISFEPDPENFKKLNERHQTDKKWVVVDYALGKEKRSLDFHIMKSSAFNSFLEPDSSATKGFEERNSVVKTITMETKRLDEVAKTLRKTYSFENVFLKLDTQGFDLDVFEGASGCLHLIRGVQTEVSVMPIYKNMRTIEDSLRAFKAKGFEVSGLYSLNESRFPHAVEFDCIYLPRCR